MGKRTTIISVLIVSVLVLSSLLFSFIVHGRITGGETSDGSKWSGMDESVIEKYAEESGHAPADPLLPVEEGDLLLFLFAAGGFISGCLVGYFWRKLFGEGLRVSSGDKPEEAGA